MNISKQLENQFNKLGGDLRMVKKLFFRPIVGSRSSVILDESEVLDEKKLLALRSIMKSGASGFLRRLKFPKSK